MDDLLFQVEEVTDLPALALAAEALATGAASQRLLPTITVITGDTSHALLCTTIMLVGAQVEVVVSLGSSYFVDAAAAVLLL